jgi:flagellar motor protein MotB
MEPPIVNLAIQEPDTDNSVSDPAIDYLMAWNFVASGNLDEAEHLLKKSGELPSSPTALDLLARIAVQKGQFEKAAKLWKVVLEKDPTNEAAKAAIEKLDSPWLTVALIKRAAVLASVTILLCLSVIGLYFLLKSEPQLQGQPAAPIISVPNASVSTVQDHTRIVFDEGLFSLRCELKDSAQKQLAILAQLLQERATHKRIVIDGHTDSYALRKDSPYKNNYELGMQRALTVALILEDQYRIEGSRIMVSSMGDSQPPFPGVDRESRLRNRTVVIRLF